MKLGAIVEFNSQFEDKLKWCTDNGIFTCQLSIGLDSQTAENAELIRTATAKAGMEITALIGSWSGPAVWDFIEGPLTLGIVPVPYRFIRIKELVGQAKFAADLGVKDVCTHIGFIPEDPSNATYKELVPALRYIASCYKQQGIGFNLETGQETPVSLLRLINDVDMDNIGLNFDPANLLMYGKANPIDALSIVGHLVRGVHAKDGCYPTNGKALGEEMPLGEGMVNIPAFIAKLHEVGYKGAVTIEREISGDKQRDDILMAKKLLEPLL